MSHTSGILLLLEVGLLCCFLINLVSEERWSLPAVCCFKPCNLSGDCLGLVMDLVQMLKAFNKQNEDH